MREVKWHERDVKDDATRGRSHLRPITYKRDALVQVWMDSRQLAVVFKWLWDNEVKVRFLSEVVNETFDMLVEKLVSQGQAKMIETTAEAREVLRYFKVDFNPGGKGTKNLTHNLLLDGKRKPVMQPTVQRDEYETAKEAAERHGLPMPSREQFYDTLEKLRADKESEQIAEIRQSDAEMQQRKEILRASGQIVDLPPKTNDIEEEVE